MLSEQQLQTDSKQKDFRGGLTNAEQRAAKSKRPCAVTQKSQMHVVRPRATHENNGMTNKYRKADPTRVKSPEFQESGATINRFA